MGLYVRVQYAMYFILLDEFAARNNLADTLLITFRYSLRADDVVNTVSQ